MKTAIHPTYNSEVTVTCACGNSFVTGSTKDQIIIELCSNCHPFYTGKQKLVDTARRVDRFQKIVAQKEDAAKGKKGRTAKRVARSTKRVLKIDESKKVTPKKKASTK